jgi:DNA-binding NtrC family response regulator
MKNILVIDDEQPVRKVICRYLENDQYDVDDVGSAEEAIEAVKNKLYQLVITDILLPEKNGMELMADLRDEYPGLKFLAISGGGHIPADLYLQSALNQGAALTLIKPFSQDELLEAVDKLLD